MSEIDENRINERKESLKTKACRHIILIRHGQYNLKGETDELRKLTELGNIWHYNLNLIFHKCE